MSNIIKLFIGFQILILFIYLRVFILHFDIFLFLFNYHIYPNLIFLFHSYYFKLFTNMNFFHFITIQFISLVISFNPIFFRYFLNIM